MEAKMKSLAVLFLAFLVCPLYLSAAPLAEDEETVTITVSKKDKLVSICNTWLENPDNWKMISAFNQLKNPHLIYPGQRINIPVKLLKGFPMEGVVSFIKGDVWICPKGTGARTLLKQGDVVGQDAQIETGKKSAVEITFAQGSRLFLKPETQVNITAARQLKPHFIILKLLMPVGRILLDIQKRMGGDSRIEIQTPSAISAARGTVFRVSVGTDETTRTEVMDGMVCVEGTGKEVLLHPGQGTRVEKGKQPGMPQTLLPPPHLEGMRPLYQHLPVAVSLVMPQTAVAARLILANDAGMKDVVEAFTVKSGDPLPDILLPDGEYYCQTSSINSAGLEGFPLEPERFKVRIHPLPPLIQRPVNGQELKTRLVTVAWSAVRDAVSYSLQVSRTSDFTQLYNDIQGITGNSQSIELDGHGVYYFRVRSIAEDAFKGVWSDATFFRFVEPPNPPKTQVPIVDKQTLFLQCEDMGPGMTYLFQIARDPLFTEDLLEKTADVSQVCFDTPQKGGDYYFRVKTVDSDGYEGRFTPSRTFEIRTFSPADLGAMAIWMIGALIIIL